MVFLKVDGEEQQVLAEQVDVGAPALHSLEPVGHVSVWQGDSISKQRVYL